MCCKHTFGAQSQRQPLEQAKRFVFRSLSDAAASAAAVVVRVSFIYFYA